MSESKPNVQINGAGEVTGGTYGQVTINGSGTVNSEITCDVLTVSGTATLRGNVVAGTISVNGTGRFEGTVQASEMTINGHSSITGGAGVGTLRVRGTADFGGSVAARDVDVKGNISVSGDVQADRWIGEGRFTVGGLLKADVIEWYLYERSGVREIRGERIAVRLRGRNSGWAQLISIFGAPRLTADTIEGDSVVLENTTAKVVRGATVVIDEGCEIELVEYSGRLDTQNGGVVREERHTTA